MYDHLGKDLTLEAVAKHVELSKCYFCTQFKKYTGLSPKRI
ncbi:helix-turn-helix transcriptional regulator [Acetivibrio straminisolvens]